jgi:protein-S-isoprenylcysteine O-methyltransferase Ste14
MKPELATRGATAVNFSGEDVSDAQVASSSVPSAPPADVLSGPGNRVRPMLVYAAGVAAAAGLQVWKSLPIDAAGVGFWQRVIGSLLVTAGIGLTWWCLSLFARAGTGLMPDTPSQALITRGPYRASRNPMFVGFSLIYVGLAVLLNLGWALVALPVVIAVVTLGVIRREERYLRDTFGGEYARFCRRTPRWL